MKPDWAAENLQTIRLLMERSALYRRALAPGMLLAGAVGLVAAFTAHQMQIHSLRGFVVFWFGVSLIPLAGSFLIVRRQALLDQEPLLSPPAKRVLKAGLPPMMAGLALGVIEAAGEGRLLAVQWLPALWAILYGTALHAAGFFTTGGLRRFGWLQIAGGCLLLGFGTGALDGWTAAHAAMGFFFGLLHLGYGAYLFVTESRSKLS